MLSQVATEKASGSTVANLAQYGHNRNWWIEKIKAFLPLCFVILGTQSAARDVNMSCMCTKQKSIITRSGGCTKCQSVTALALSKQYVCCNCNVTRDYSPGISGRCSCFRWAHQCFVGRSTSSFFHSPVRVAIVLRSRNVTRHLEGAPNIVA